MTGVASLALVMVSAGGLRAEIVTVQGDGGAAGSDASNSGNDAQSGGEGESVSANAGSTQPITAPKNQAIAGGGGGGQGGNGVYGDTAAESGGAGGNGGAADAAAFTTIVSGAGRAEASSYGGYGGGAGSASQRSGTARAAMAATADRQPRLRGPRPSWGPRKRTPMLTADPAEVTALPGREEAPAPLVQR
jgi:hypothetical protein